MDQDLGAFSLLFLHLCKGEVLFKYKWETNQDFTYHDWMNDGCNNYKCLNGNITMSTYLWKGASPEACYCQYLWVIAS